MRHTEKEKFDLQGTLKLPKKCQTSRRNPCYLNKYRDNFAPLVRRKGVKSRGRRREAGGRESPVTERGGTLAERVFPRKTKSWGYCPEDPEGPFISGRDPRTTWTTGRGFPLPTPDNARLYTERLEEFKYTTSGLRVIKCHTDINLYPETFPITSVWLQYPHLGLGYTRHKKISSTLVSIHVRGTLLCPSSTGKSPVPVSRVVLVGTVVKLGCEDRRL